jgi:hypothetical protein
VRKREVRRKAPSVSEMGRGATTLLFLLVALIHQPPRR